MNNFSANEPLHAHVSDPPDDPIDFAQFATKEIATDGNFDKHLFKHVSDPPEALNDCVKIATKDASTDGKFSEHLFKHVSDPPEAKVTTDVKLTKLVSGVLSKGKNSYYPCKVTVNITKPTR